MPVASGGDVGFTALLAQSSVRAGVERSAATRAGSGVVAQIAPIMNPTDIYSMNPTDIYSGTSM
jgi:hypothetical protein